ncbi:MAG: hypothetical protein JWQ96_2251 [Segetibacter sp.]|nr:hypothetical protein [Segetibacter sp.]
MLLGCRGNVFYVPRAGTSIKRPLRRTLVPSLFKLPFLTLLSCIFLNEQACLFVTSECKIYLTAMHLKKN